MNPDTLSTCTRCPRLVAWREQIAVQKVKRFAHDTYWAKPVPSFGSLKSRLLIVGLAPAAHGANRTGRMFTGDRSGDWLCRALYKAGLASQPTSTHCHDGLELNDCRITAMVHCAPPDNKPTPDEQANCQPYLVEELAAMPHLQHVVCLGKLAFDAVLNVLVKDYGAVLPKPKPAFGHGVRVSLACPGLSRTLTVIASYHPSQQNTFTGKLTEPMLDAIFEAIFKTT